MWNFQNIINILIYKDIDDLIYLKFKIYSIINLILKLVFPTINSPYFILVLKKCFYFKIKLIKEAI